MPEEQPFSCQGEGEGDDGGLGAGLDDHDDKDDGDGGDRFGLEENTNSPSRSRNNATTAVPGHSEATVKE